MVNGFVSSVGQDSQSVPKKAKNDTKNII